MARILEFGYMPISYGGKGTFPIFPFPTKKKGLFVLHRLYSSILQVPSSMHVCILLHYIT